MARRDPTSPAARPAWPGAVLLGLVVLAAAPFAVSSALQGLDGIDGVQREPTRLFHAGDTAANLGIFTHMIAGAAITVLALLQPIAAIRDRWPRFHRLNGRLVVAAALVTATGGLLYIAAQGTIGGPGMSAGFGLYGLCLAGTAAMTFRTARARDFDAHRRWALRLVWLAIGSWLYRVQYGLWYAATGGARSTPQFDGPFDQAMFVGFFLPHLLLLEIYLRRRAHVEPAPRRG
ncbi:MAG: DUF2306 domain-containing protein [Pseudomonadota bacterium]